MILTFKYKESSTVPVPEYPFTSRCHDFILVTWYHHHHIKKMSYTLSSNRIPSSLSVWWRKRPMKTSASAVAGKRKLQVFLLPIKINHTRQNIVVTYFNSLVLLAENLDFHWHQMTLKLDFFVLFATHSNSDIFAEPVCAVVFCCVWTK